MSWSPGRVVLLCWSVCAVAVGMLFDENSFYSHAEQDAYMVIGVIGDANHFLNHFLVWAARSRPGPTSTCSSVTAASPRNECCW
jgi:hypothetical protein